MTKKATAVRRVHRHGIDFYGQVYRSVDLTRHCPVGSRVQVRTHAHQPNTLDVFADGTWVCTAQAANSMSDVLAWRTAQRDEVARRMAMLRLPPGWATEHDAVPTQTTHDIEESA